MTTVRTPIGSAVDAIQRVPATLWLDPSDDPNGFPNYPVYADASGRLISLDPVAGTASGEPATCVWDGAFGRDTALLLAAIGTNPERMPADASKLDRAALFSLYAAEIAEAKAALAQVHL